VGRSINRFCIGCGTAIRRESPAVWCSPCSIERARLSGRATGFVVRALKRGSLVRPDECSHCGAVASTDPIQALHPDYSKPLDVVWLCRACHRREHVAENATRRSA
jgi:hypothetical protein